MRGLMMTLGAIIAGVIITISAQLHPARSPEDIHKIVRELAQRADSADDEAMFHLAQLHLTGYDSIPTDSLRALQLLESSSLKGNLQAQNLLGYLLIKRGRSHSSGNEGESDISRGLYWLEEAAMAGDAKAQSNIGYLLLEGEGVVIDEEKAAFWLERAAQKGVASASSMLGDLYRDGRGVSRDSLQAEAHYLAAIDRGLTDAAYKLEAMQCKTWMQESDSLQLRRAIYFYTHRAPGVALPILRRLARLNPDETPSISSPLPADSSIYAHALALLGDAYTRGIGVSYDHQKSIDYYLRAAKAGNPSAAFVISELLEIFPDALADYEIRQDLTDPAYWLQIAASGGVTTSEEANRHLLHPLEHAP